ncbi:MAG: hypothetical protein KAT40_08040, partial [Bacteroidales bacterium]|nr:hypothetical protein [Bacteroidales bacterium]
MNPEEAYKLERDKIIPASQDSLIKEDISSLPQNISTLKVESLQEDITRRKIFIDTGIEHIHVRTYDSF